MMQLGATQPAVATMEPGMPATFVPTKVAALRAIGPGVIWEIVTRCVNSFIESQAFSLMTCSWISGSAA